jgi:hypothetical protein
MRSSPPRQAAVEVARVEPQVASRAAHDVEREVLCLRQRLDRDLERFGLGRQGRARHVGKGVEGAPHGAMADAGFQIFLAHRFETELLVETDRIDLRVQFDLGVAAFARQIEQRLQQGLADAPSAPLAQHRHAPDRALRRQPAGADRAALRVARQHVAALRVDRIEFDVGRHVLFLHEHDVAHGPQCRLVEVVVRDLDAEIVADHAGRRRGARDSTK